MSITQDASAPTQDASAPVDPAPADTIDLTEPHPARTLAPGQGPADPSAPVRPVFTITEAATACAVSRKTITRKLADLAEHGAAKDEDGVWRIPVEALLAVGLHPGRSLPERRGDSGEPARAPSASGTPAPRPAPAAGPDTVTISRDRWDDLRIRLARAEAQAAERDLALADARLALRALTAGPALSVVATPVANVRTDSPPAPPVVLPTPVADAAHRDRVTGEGPATPTEAPAVQRRTDAAPAGQAAPSPGVGVGDAAAPADPRPDLARARSQAARTGGYVPAADQPTKRRRWWHSK